MVLRKLSAFIVIGFMVVPAHATLEEGRAHLAASRLKEAEKAYGDIPFGHPQWAEKVDDLIRYHLLKGSALEAWRLVQLLKRVGANPSGLMDYERLAIFKAGSCPLALTGDEPMRAALLNAATYRFLPSFQQMTGDALRFGEESGGSQLVAGLTPYLRDIPKTALVKNNGCALEKLRLRTVPAVRKAEAVALAEFLAHGATRAKSVNSDEASEEAVARLLVLARLMQLARDLDDDGLKGKIDAVIGSYSSAPMAIPWAKLPDAERRWLFLRLFTGGTLEDVPEARRETAQAIARLVLENEKSLSAADWLGLVEIESLPRAKRVQLLSTLESRGGFSGRSWVLLKLAQARYEGGEMVEALAVLRRLLLEGEESVEGALQEASVDLAARIFTEHRLDERMMGAIHSSLPSRLWGALLEQATLRAAIAGRTSDFERLAGWTEKRGGIRSLRGEGLALVRSVAKRNLASFRSGLKTPGNRSGGYQTLMVLAGQLVSSLMDASDAERASLAPFANELGRELRSRLRPGDPKSEETGDLVHSLEQDASEWVRGGKGVRRGTVKAGVARVSRATDVPNPFLLKAPAALPLRRLYYVPDQIAGRGWVLSVEAK